MHDVDRFVVGKQAAMASRALRQVRNLLKPDDGHLRQTL